MIYIGDVGPVISGLDPKHPDNKTHTANTEHKRNVGFLIREHFIFFPFSFSFIFLYYPNSKSYKRMNKEIPNIILFFRTGDINE
jgi:hypothetical protein